MSTFVTHSVQGNLATVTLARPDVHNAFDEVVIRELTNAFDDIAKSPEVRVAVLESHGKSFCAGADVHWMKRMVDYSVEENIRDADEMAHMLDTIRTCSKPVIARVHGDAYGGGVGLLAACDLAAAVDSARFCLSEVKLGIAPAVISPFVLKRIGPGEMRRYALTAERFSATEARRIGLINERFATVVEMDDWIADQVHRLKRNGPAALAACKEVLDAVPSLDWQAARKLTTRRIAELRVSAEGQDGLRAFLEKRPPDWITEE